VAIHEVPIAFVRATAREFPAAYVGLAAQSLPTGRKHDAIEQQRSVAFGAPASVRCHERRLAPVLACHGEARHDSESDGDSNEKNS
jgi:hypothetical protein